MQSPIQPSYARSVPPAGVAAPSKALYFSLYGDAEDTADRTNAARAYLEEQLAAVRLLPHDLPARPADLPAWIERRTAAIGEQYRDYLAGRKNGAPRRYFSSKSHALYFLKSVAPTKLVDGSWLYGVLARWDDADFGPLIKIYLEELGEGLPDKNHVLIYQKLLDAHGCGHWDSLDEAHFVQGAIQLSLARDARHFLPEVIGFNLGYEQLPLHLLISAYELNELGIDPYYFTLHITVDNAANGHALDAMAGLQRLMPRVGDAEAFYRRVIDGYRLNDLGASTTSVIAEFDLDDELTDILAAKSVIGKNMHSDYCRIEGRNVNDWLSAPEQIPAFLHSLEKKGWIKRGQQAEDSRFWNLIHGDHAEMFGVFNAYEQQILRDWIEMAPALTTGNTPALPRVLSHRARQRMRNLPAAQAERPQGQRGVLRLHAQNDNETADDFGGELRLLEERLAAQADKHDTMAMLIKLMAPSAHHTAAGLMATRIFSQLLD
jgi:hypothetical protein